MPRTRFSLLLVSLCLLAFCGFGCKKQTGYRTYALPSSFTDARVPTADSSAPPPATIDPHKPKDVEHGTDPDIILLRQVMKNLMAASSFRANMTIPTDNGTLNGDIEFARGKGLHGVLHLPNQSTTEIYLVNQQILFRSGTSSWANLTNTTDGLRLASLFSSAFSLKADSTSTSISDSSRILNVSDDPSGCTLYTFEEPLLGTTSYETTKICVKDNLPQYFRIGTVNGDIVVTYRDFNTDIPVSSPLK